MLAQQMASFLGANRTRVVYETIDGETILIHLGTGTYYSLDGSGSEVWEMLAPGSTREALLEAGRERYEGDPLAVDMGLSGLIDELLREELLVEYDAPRGPIASRQLPSGQAPFSVPVLQAYTDMQEFMLVDPIHDVDGVAGWPHVGAA
jgi:Coenzyme PQQ synthesis protein D (PqqD)